MRPLSLEFQAFGPYAGREHIDFEDLTSKGLLLICGDTGSGKTMILEEGDSIYFDSSKPHGMLAVGDKPVRFLAFTVE